MFTIKFPIEAIRKKLGNCERRIAAEMRVINEAVGTQLLSFAKQDYRTKSRGGTGTDGISWKPLKQSTINAKNRRGKRNTNRKTTKGGKARPGLGSSAIGIDTGLQQSSASPGFIGSDGKGGNILEVTETSVTVGYGREYSGHFDVQRPLLPSVMPDKWREASEGIVSRRVEKILREELR